MEKLQIRKLSQAIQNTTNKIKFCATLAVTELDEDEIDGLSRILEGCVEELEQATDVIDLLKPSDFAMQKNAGKLYAVPTINAVKLPQEQRPA